MREQLTTYQKPHEAGRIVAELPFGFCSSMFNRPYEPVWYADGARPLTAVFPNLPRTLRKRKLISQRVEQIRLLRNRVSPFTVARTKTLAHETTHYLADHKGDGDRHDAETVAEAPAFVAMNHFNLDTGDYSFHYLTGWAEDKEHLHTNLEEIRRIIRAVEGVGDPCEDEFGSFEAIGTRGYWPKRSSRWKRRSIGTPLISEDMPGYIDRCLDRFCSTCADVDTVNCVG